MIRELMTSPISKKIKKKLTVHQRIEEKLKTVYDPEFPIIDIFTLGLIYNVGVKEKEKKVDVLMTFTTPACPMAELIQELIKNAIAEIVPGYKISITITFDPMRTYDMIRDEDLKKMFL